MAKSRSKTSRKKRIEADLEKRLARLERRTKWATTHLVELVGIVRGLQQLVEDVTARQAEVNEVLLKLGRAASERAVKALVIAADRSPQQPPSGAPLH